MPDNCSQINEAAKFIQNESFDSWFNTESSLYHCTYNTDFYRDSLFEQLGVNFPETMHNAVVKRRAEFLAGRYCALKTLQKHHLHIPVIGIGKNRNPLWPSGIFGSISHANDCAVAVTSNNSGILGLGIDIEACVTPETMDRIQSQILCEDELSLVLRHADDPIMTFTLAFSLKESFFKAAFLSVGRYFDFYAVSLTSIDREAHRVDFRVNENLSGEIRKGDRLSGAFCMPFPQKVATMVMLLR